ncbi:DUF962 domain-containing protein [Sandaracinus amylolyticus]|uniref:Transmembrane protein n=1 Tax=Sandaracinus amylolyticus TaxID=927083 RepID=A0A0F6SFY0_9BACT|nr:DUF962 domain-containing protein [Sandaracinus amylolyticus]AKF07729.1 hypothetical protein DB32_004878 [Sandaracinus amylolyticus]
MSAHAITTVAPPRRAEELLTLPPLVARLPILRELPAFWPIYLWHHRRPWTRRLHHAGSWSCIAGAGLAIALGAWWPVLLGLLVGYGLAFAGHWVVERNRPLTFGRPILAGIGNWIMFALEVGGRLEVHLQVVEEQPRDDWDDYDVGSN